ncbi:LANO_0H07602g1_1 [Lachancea nothofagi CBS 11611]|uniref:LANO_0H07602g1_1 n=1 Tax=Lachancea nothofagi CBS 11611 TaxID=1266666 RepID=A0A1G4KLT4_9SACH|nr:LANO_0H07602g1_1 [Lachancea nothofagi CBS 11611]
MPSSIQETQHTFFKDASTTTQVGFSRVDRSPIILHCIMSFDSSLHSSIPNRAYLEKAAHGYEGENDSGSEDKAGEIHAKHTGNLETASRLATREMAASTPDSASTLTLFDAGKVQTSLGVPHTLLNTAQKWTMVGLLTSAGFWSSLGSPIYYPALKQLEKQFDVSEELVNITVVVYLIFQGVAPTICGSLADVYGRRPVILFGMLVYVCASIGLACSQSYGVILFLRCLQSAGISPIIAINSGVVGDFTLKHERGTFVGAVSGFTLMGQAFGSLIGAALTAAFDWRAIFWFLTIGCGTCMIINFLVLPETKRTLVGNMSIRPKHWVNRAPIFLLKSVRHKFHYDNPDYETLDPNVPKIDLISSLKILSHPEILMSLMPAGLQFALWTLTLTSISSQLSIAPYNYKLTIIGICYLPAGIGGLVGSFITGKIIDVYYKRALKRFEEKKQQGLIASDAKFNTLRARLYTSIPQNFVSVVAFTLFGWSIQRGWHISVPLITSAIGSFCAMSTLSSSSTLLVDLYPNRSSTATSSYNFIRCSLSAIFMACLARMNKALTVGGTFTLVSGFIFIGNFVTFIPMIYGMKWRENRAFKAERKAMMTE